MADAPRMYDPTQRHLRRLREEGRGPHVAAVRGVAVLIVTVVASTLLLRYAAHDLAPRWAATLAGASSADVTASLAGVRSLALWSSGALLALLFCACLALWAMDALWAGLSSRRHPLVSRALWRPAAVRSWALAVLVEVCALALVAAVAWPLISFAADSDSPVLSLARFGPLAILAAAAVVLITAADLATSYLFFIADARMSRADLLEEQRDQQPAAPVVRRRAGRLSRRRS
jgi:flagellar biosynthesis protein FlhB